MGTPAQIIVQNRHLAYKSVQIPRKKIKPTTQMSLAFDRNLYANREPPEGRPLS